MPLKKPKPAPGYWSSVFKMSTVLIRRGYPPEAAYRMARAKVEELADQCGLALFKPDKEPTQSLRLT